AAREAVLRGMFRSRRGGSADRLPNLRLRSHGWKSDLDAGRARQSEAETRVRNDRLRRFQPRHPHQPRGAGNHTEMESHQRSTQGGRTTERQRADPSTNARLSFGEDSDDHLTRTGMNSNLAVLGKSDHPMPPSG